MATGTANVSVGSPHVNTVEAVRTIEITSDNGIYVSEATVAGAKEAVAGHPPSGMGVAVGSLEAEEELEGQRAGFVRRVDPDVEDSGAVDAWDSAVSEV